MTGDNRKMTREALDIILKLWAANEPFEYRGEYWNVNRIESWITVRRIQWFGSTVGSNVLSS